MIEERHWRILGFDSRDDRLRQRAALLGLTDETAKALLDLADDDDLLGEYPLTEAQLNVLLAYLAPGVTIDEALIFQVSLGRGPAPSDVKWHS